jgi:hypothetical protein
VLAPHDYTTRIVGLMGRSQNSVFATKAVDEVYERKARERVRLASLPIEEKVDRLIKLQQRAREVAVATGRKAPMVWKIHSASLTTS